MASEQFLTSWGDSVTVPLADTKLPYDIDVLFWNSTTASNTKRDVLKREVVPPPTPVDPYESWPVNITAGTNVWDSTDTDSSKTVDSPLTCRVGKWDNGNFGDWLTEILSLGDVEYLPNRQMDCYWSC